MRVLKILYLILLCVMLTSCTKSIYTSFETSRAKMQELSGFDIIQCSKIIKESVKNEEEILSNKGLIDYKKQYFKNGRNIQINQYEITKNKEKTIIKNKTNNTIIQVYNDNEAAAFNISYDKQYLGICDRGKLHIFGRK